jgi:hypothetical protein
VRVRPYQASDRPRWNAFVGKARNGVFLFDRGYMDYHSDRFTDASLLVCDDEGRLVAVFPASAHQETVVSHGGLTFGGLLFDERMRAPAMLHVMSALLEHLAERGFTRLVYKAVPHIYHRAPAQDDLYALFRAGARLVRRDLSSTIDTRCRIGYAKGRRWAVKRAEQGGMRLCESRDFHGFMRVEEENLGERHGVRPVHSGDELALLAARFPRNIRLFCALDGARVLAGTVVYESGNVAHAQYIGSTPEGRERSALDLVIDHLLREVYADKPYFDFGISTECEGRRLNEGLVANKEGWGARATVYDFYEVELAR